ncbi:hypothetical protein SAY86_001171 [Trapa natans]|uniref:Uncharacterized protein n=1 Tax=Trapa natans TaxID=22666 RepID=A0AAN7RNM7_TRANT|nr:hypothetical protein SAY86_001171 [Trapa natans]
MVEKKVVKMLVQVNDLQCFKCNRKIKKILCEFPQIRDQIYDEKKNTVTITVECCSPEKIMNKIRCKGECVVTSIAIIPDKPTVKIVEPPPQTKPTPSIKPTPPPVPVPVLMPTAPPLPCHRPAPPPLGVSCYPGPYYGCNYPCNCQGYAPLPPMCNDGCGRLAYECSYGGGYRNYRSRSWGECLSDENANGCTIL